MDTFTEKFNKYYSDCFSYSDYSKSTAFVTLHCKRCGYIFKKLAYAVTRGNKLFCPVCDGGYKLTEDLLRYKLNYFFKGKYSLIGDYDPSSRKVKMRCNVCGKVWDCLPSMMFCKTRKSGCPNCAHNQNFSTSEFTKKLKKKYGHKYRLLGEYVSSRTKMKFYCRKHKHCFYCTGNVILRKSTKYPCPECLKNPYEDNVAKFLTERGFIFEQQKTFDDCFYKEKLRFDFYIPKQKTLENDVLLELQGIQHYIPIKQYKNEKFKISKIRDKIKKEYALTHNYQFIAASDCSLRNDEDWSLDKLFKFLEKL